MGRTPLGFAFIKRHSKEQSTSPRSTSKAYVINAQSTSACSITYKRIDPRDGSQRRLEDMKTKTGLSVYAVLLTACATSSVRTVGPDTYSLSATRCGLCQPVSAYVTDQAGQFCQSKGKQVVVTNISSNNLQPMFPGSATITFSCADHVNPRELMVAATNECKADYQSPELDAIRSKVELYRDAWDAAPPFTIASNENFPTELEHKAIARWAELRDACMARQRAVPRVPPTATQLQAVFIAQDASFGEEVSGKVSALIVALYQGKLNYGEFAEKRYEFGRDGAAAEREFRQATLIADQQRQIQAQQLAQQNFQNRLAIWSTYLQTVNSRPAQTNIQVQQSVTVH